MNSSTMERLGFPMTRILFFAVLVMAFVLSGFYAREAKAGMYISLSGPGAGTGDTIYCGLDVTVNIHLYNDWVYDIEGMTNGFELYSQDGATWSIPSHSTTGDFCSHFDLLCQTDGFSLTGDGADTIGVGAVTMISDGLAPEYDGIIATITTQVGCGDAGKHLCIDSAFYGLSGEWLWINQTYGTYYPSWTGPHCFYVKEVPDEIWWKEPNGIYMPDFDQNQMGWSAYCGPTATANCLWWFNERFPGWGLIPPMFDPPQLIDSLATLMSTNVPPTEGTNVDSLQSGVDQWLAIQNCTQYLAETTVYVPDFDYCREQLLDCQDVILLMGFWEVTEIIPDQPEPGCYEIHWHREGGHYVTMAGVDTLGDRAGFSDPDKDAAETSLPCPPSRVLGPNHNHPSGHNDGVSVSHDVYDVSRLGISPGGSWEIVNYWNTPKFTSVDKYKEGTNPNPRKMKQEVTIWCNDLPPWIYVGAVVTEVEDAVIICPKAPAPDTVKCEPQGGGNPTHPDTYWYDVTPGDFGRCDFHVQVEDSVASHYSNWVEPTGWGHSLHKAGGSWWVSWWDPGCTNAIFSTFRFQFDNSNPGVWKDWRTTIDGSDDPFAQIIDSSANHSSEADGYGYRVHAPHWDMPHSSCGISVTISGPGAGTGDTILVGQPVTFDIHLYNCSGYKIMGMTHGFEIYSPEGATWAVPTYDTAGGLGDYFDLGVFTTSASVTGSGADSIGVGGAAVMPGIPNGYDDTIFTITTQVGSNESGKHLCIDSAYIPPSWSWLWSLSGGPGTVVPAWNGPKCYYIKDPNASPCGLSATISGPGAGTADTILSDQLVTFDIHLRNCTGENIIGMSNGFKLYSSDGATWAVPTYDTTGGLDNYFNLFIGTYGNSVTGSGADTMGFAAIDMTMGGLPDGFDDTVFTISTVVPGMHVGKHLCIDSSYFRSGGTWVWSLQVSGAYTPNWNGSLCFYVKQGPVSQRDTVVCEPQGGVNPTHPVTYWYDVTLGGTTGLCDFHVKVEDEFIIYYSNWVEPTGWTHTLHQVGSDWWVSWWNPGCTNPIMPGNTFRFQFDNPHESVWNEWRTTISGTDDPTDQVVDSAPNHGAEPNGYGYLVHVPHFEMPEIKAISLDEVTNLWEPDQIPSMAPIRFIMRWKYMTNDGSTLDGFQNGFRIYSPDGATWQPITYDTLSLNWISMFDGGVFMNPYSITGSGADTIGFAGVRLFGTGIVAPFDSQVYWIETSVFPSDTGKHLCIDSCWYPPAMDWLWASSIMGAIKPAWDGPHCFEIVYDSSKCDCEPGEMNGDSIINIFDVTGLISYLYLEGAPPIPYEVCSGDMNGDCVVNIFDVTGLISYLYLEGTPPVSCEEWLTNCDVPLRK